jgi:outer membrane protein OmpA-like peptidoglycan-associated protein
MKQYYESLKNLINQDMISKASLMLKENETNVSAAVSTIISGLLGIMLKKGDTQQMRNILEEAQSSNINTVSKIENLWNENPTPQQRKLGDDFLQELLGDKAVDFTSAIYKSAGISKVATNRLVAMVSPIVTGFLGDQLVKEKWQLSDLLDEINKQKNNFAGFIPADMINSFGLANVLNRDYKVPNRKKNHGWITWIILLILLLLLFYWWKSCRSTSIDPILANKGTVTDTITGNRNQPTTIINETNRAAFELTLTDGTKIRVYRDGTEEKFTKFINSNEYKKASNDELKKRWFELDNITFEFNSSTQLTSSSKAQVDNLIAILKANPGVKIEVGGFADKRGSEDANLNISKERAKTIGTMLERGGVGSQVVKTEGYGDEYAQKSASASNATRASDRHISIRLVK